MLVLVLNPMTPARIGSPNKNLSLIGTVISALSFLLLTECSENLHSNLLYVFVNLCGKCFHYVNILWTVCCEYLLPNFYINSVLVSHLSDTVSALSGFCVLQIHATFEVCVNNPIQHIFCYYISFCLNSLL